MIPDKIFRTTTYLDNDKGKVVWKETPVNGAENIAYIRKDIVDETIKSAEDHAFFAGVEFVERQVRLQQSEKDFALTAEDIGLIFNKVRELQVKYPATEGCYQEVADWFNSKNKQDTAQFYNYNLTIKH